MGFRTADVAAWDDLYTPPEPEPELVLEGDDEPEVGD